MNFLSHGLLVRRTGSAGVLVGSAMPDLAPLADRKLRLTPRRLDALEELGAVDVVRGCRHHKLVDRTFHHGQAFHLTETDVAEVLPPLDLVLPTRMMAHMLVEIAVDAEVLRRYPTFCREEYPAAFEEFDWPWLLRLLAEVTGVDTRPFAHLVDRFDRGAFLLTYTDDLGVLDRIDGMLRRIAGDGLTDEQRAALEPVVAAARRLGRERFRALMPWELELDEEGEEIGFREELSIG